MQSTVAYHFLCITAAPYACHDPGSTGMGLPQLNVSMGYHSHHYNRKLVSMSLSPLNLQILLSLHNLIHSKGSELHVFSGLLYFI